MSFRRDGISSNVEISGELDEIFEKRGEHMQLEDLKYHLQNPERQRELLSKWLHEQDHWLKKLPQINESLQNETTLLKLNEYLVQLDLQHIGELEELLNFLEIEGSDQSMLILQLQKTFHQYTDLRARIAKEMPENASQISRILNSNPLAQRVETTTEAEEIPDPLT